MRWTKRVNSGFFQWHSKIWIPSYWSHALSQIELFDYSLSFCYCRSFRDLYYAFSSSLEIRPKISKIEWSTCDFVYTLQCRLKSMGSNLPKISYHCISTYSDIIIIYGVLQWATAYGACVITAIQVDIRTHQSHLFFYSSPFTIRCRSGIISPVAFID